MRLRGFSLFELLAVMAVLAVLAALTLPAVTQSVRATKLSVASQNVSDHLALARQTARTRNLPVEVRLYKMPSADGAPDSYRAFQLLCLDENGSSPISRLQELPSPVQFSASPGEAGLIGLTEQAPSGDDHAVRRFGPSVRYVSFRFQPGGSAAPQVGADAVNTTNSFVTLVLNGDPAPADGGNYAVVQVDPFTGSLRTLRP
jgi:uncharacterized protein (TIGR02596 family)